MQKLLTLTLIFIFIAIPTNATFAEEGDRKKMLEQQITALTRYIDHNFLPLSEEPLSNSELRAIIDGSQNWLREAQEDGGHFRYEYFPYEDTYGEDDNIVRQAGALYSLGEIARRDPDKKLDSAETIEKAIGFFEGLSIDGSMDEEEFRCIALNRVSSKCKLGATSLALAGILGYLEQHPEKYEEHEDLVEDYVAFVLAMKKPGEGFRNIYNAKAGSQTKKESSFSNGEALMVLTRYYLTNPDEEIKDVIDAGFDHLKDQPFDSALYLWIMAALKDMNELWDKDAYISYGKDYTAWRIEGGGGFKKSTRNFCPLTEGLVSAYTLLENDMTEFEKDSLKAEIDYWNIKNGTLQLTSDDIYRLNNTEGGPSFGSLDKPERAIGGFLTGRDILAQRIDFTQHCVTTYVQTLVDVNGGEI